MDFPFPLPGWIVISRVSPLSRLGTDDRNFRAGVQQGGHEAAQQAGRYVRARRKFGRVLLAHSAIAHIPIAHTKFNIIPDSPHPFSTHPDSAPSKKSIIPIAHILKEFLSR